MISCLVKNIRKKLHLTQKQLAELVFVDSRTISNYENGVSMPSIELMKEICERVGISIMISKNGYNFFENDKEDLMYNGDGFYVSVFDSDYGLNLTVNEVVCSVVNESPKGCASSYDLVWDLSQLDGCGAVWEEINIEASIDECSCVMGRVLYEYSSTSDNINLDDDFKVVYDNDDIYLFYFKSFDKKDVVGDIIKSMRVDMDNYVLKC